MKEFKTGHGNRNVNCTEVSDICKLKKCKKIVMVFEMANVRRKMLIPATTEWREQDVKWESIRIYAELVLVHNGNP